MVKEWLEAFDIHHVAFYVYCLCCFVNKVDVLMLKKVIYHANSVCINVCVLIINYDLKSRTIRVRQSKHIVSKLLKFNTTAECR